MKRDGAKKIKWLWLGICLAVLAVAATVVILVANTGDNTPQLYWNVDREENTDPDTGLSLRKPGEDGNYHIRFAYNGEQVELAVADKALVNTIDAMDVMELTLDKEGIITKVQAAKDVANVFCERMYVQEITEDAIVINSSIAMAGNKITIKITERLQVYNMSGRGEFVGQKIALQELQEMDTVCVYGTRSSEKDKSVATHIFVMKQWEIGKVYWRTERLYDSKTKGTSRTPDESGIYTVAFYCDGETVELKFKEKSLVDVVDYTSANSCYFGFEFDKDGYVEKLLNSNKASHTVLQCERYDIVELNADGSYVAADALGGSGQKVSGVIGKDCAIYEISPKATAEGAMNRKVDSLQLYDRVYIWTDTVGNPVLVYITARRPDSPAYYNPDPQYDSKNKQTTRTPNADGYYEIELLKAGETALQTYYTKDINLVNTIDSAADRCVGLNVGEGNVIKYVYAASNIFGNSNLCRGYTVREASSSMIVVVSSTGKTVKNGVISTDCKIWDVSGEEHFGEETTLREGDRVYVMREPFGEIINVYVTGRAQNKGK